MSRMPLPHGYMAMYMCTDCQRPCCKIDPFGTRNLVSLMNHLMQMIKVNCAVGIHGVLEEAGEAGKQGCLRKQNGKATIWRNQGRDSGCTCIALQL